MKLSEAYPEHLRGISPLRDRKKIAGLQQILDGGHVSRYRRVDYQCEQGHRLGQVLDTPEGQVLLLTTDADDIVGPQLDRRRRARGQHLAIDISELQTWLAATQHMAIGHTVDVRCRCLQPLQVSLDGIAKDAAARRGRVLVRPAAQRLG